MGASVHTPKSFLPHSTSNNPQSSIPFFTLSHSKQIKIFTFPITGFKNPTIPFSTSGFRIGERKTSKPPLQPKLPAPLRFAQRPNPIEIENHTHHLFIFIGKKRSFGVSTTTNTQIRKGEAHFIEIGLIGG